MTTYFVSTTGLDSNPGTQLSPFLTISKGLQALAPSDILYFRGGTYTQGGNGIYGNFVNETYGGGAASWAAATQILNFPGEPVTLNCSFIINGNVNPTNRYIIFQGDAVSRFIIRNQILINNAVDHIRLKLLTVRDSTVDGVHTGSSGPDFTLKPRFCEFLQLFITNNGTLTNQHHGIYNSNDSDMLIDGCYLFANEGYAIHANTQFTGNRHDNLIVRNNRCEGRRAGATSTAGAIYFRNDSNGANNLIYNNVVIGKGGAAVKYDLGIQTDLGTGPGVYNNTVVDCVGDGVQVGSGGVGVIVRNNITYLCPGNVHDLATGTTKDHNLLGVNPLFTNLATLDFHLQSGSPAIDTGATVASVTTDLDGVTRPQGTAYDIGAYEFVGADTTPPAVPTGVRILP